MKIFKYIDHPEDWRQLRLCVKRRLNRQLRFYLRDAKKSRITESDDQVDFYAASELTIRCKTDFDLESLTRFIQTSEKLTKITLFEVGREVMSTVFDALTVSMSSTHPVDLELFPSSGLDWILDKLYGYMQREKSLALSYPGTVDSTRKMTGDQIVKMSNVLKANTILTFLDLRSQRFGTTTVVTIAESLALNKNLVELNLSYNTFGTDGSKALASALEINTTLKILNLASGNIGPTGIVDFQDALKFNSTLLSLDLRLNNLSDDGAVSLAAILEENRGLLYLNISDNAIAGRGITEISNALKINSSLETLDVSTNSIEDDGAQAMAEMLEVNSTLISLMLSDNEIGKDGAQFLANSLRADRNSTLRKMCLRENPFQDEGFIAIAEMLQHNTALTSLSLGDGREVGRNVLSAFEDSMKINISLTELVVSYSIPKSEIVVSALRRNDEITKLKKILPRLSDPEIQEKIRVLLPMLASRSYTRSADGLFLCLKSQSDALVNL